MNSDLEYKGAKAIVNICSGLKENEEALIVTDTEKLQIAMILAEEIKRVGSEYTIAVMEPRNTHGENPTNLIEKAMLAADVVFAPTKFSLSHSKAREKANECGVRFISMPDYDIEMLKGGALEADFLGILKIVDKIADILTNGKIAKVIFENGMIIKLNINGRIANKVSGVCRIPGTWGSPPNIEVNISPVEEDSNGNIYLNGSIPMPSIGVIEEPIILDVKNGKLNSINGGNQGKLFSRILNNANSKNSYVLGELGIGLNPEAKLKGSMLEDEGALGTIHFGWGHNYDQGGKNIAPTHIDTVVKNSTLIIDETTVIDRGQLMIK